MTRSTSHQTTISHCLFIVPLILSYFNIINSHQLSNYRRSRSNHQRKVLQSQNVSCYNYSDPYTCDILIGHHKFPDKTVQCDPSYPNCHINIATAWYFHAFPETINCPNNYCESCIIYFSACKSCGGVEINSYNCQYVSVNISYRWASSMGLYGSIIHAPGNGGKLYVTADYTAGFAWNSILSSPGTADIVVTFKTPPAELPPSSTKSYNVINGSYVTGHLNYSCLGSADCMNTIIVCGTNCNINCSSDYSDGCQNMNVHAVADISTVDWYCDDSNRRVCQNAQLKCDSSNMTIYADLKWNVVNKWYYNNEPRGCVSDWTVPVVSCTFMSNDFCYINKAIMASSSHIQCLDSLHRCQVQLGDADTDNIWPELHSIINCPTQECDFCIIDCVNDNACSHLTINGYNCSLLQINIRAPNQQNAKIYAPAHGGELKILTNWNFQDPTFYQNQIYSSPGTKNMVIDFSECYHNCGGNIVWGTHVTDYLNVSCTGTANCFFNKIYCPNDANCNVDCRGVYGYGPWAGYQCQSVDVYSKEGTHDVNIWCGGFYDSGCLWVVLHCNTTDEDGRPVLGSSEYDRDGVSNKSRFGCVDIPTTSPSASPTALTIPPTQSTEAPSVPPTAAPTYSPTSSPVIADIFLDEVEFTIAGGSSVFVFLLILCGLIYYYKCYKLERKSLYITRAMVVLIGIGEYEYVGGEEDEINAFLNNLDGIDVDIKNMVHLFHDELNYDIYPSQHINSIKNGFSPKQDWKEKELKDFLVDRAKYLEQNIEQYDGLVVVISCHGLPRYICTSDYKRFSKLAIHRIFSSPHPKIRNIPRLFLFDCCSGNNEQEIKYDTSDDEEDDTKLNTDLSKNISLRNIDGEGDTAQPWIKGEHNPDYRLALVEAANAGFQAKARGDIGSYVIYSFYNKMMSILSQNKRTFIHKVFDKIQDELHGLGKQHPEYKWNDNTRYIRFQRQKNEHKVSTSIKLAIF